MAKRQLVTIPIFAKMIGIRAERVRKVIAAGKLDTIHEGAWRKLDVGPAKKQWAAVTKKGRNPSGKKKGDGSTKTKVIVKEIATPKYQGMTTADAERKDKVYRAKLSEIKYLEQSGNLIHKDAVQKEAFEAGRKVRDSIMSVPARFAHELAAETDPHKLEVQLSNILAKSLEQSMKGNKINEQ